MPAGVDRKGDRKNREGTVKAKEYYQQMLADINTNGEDYAIQKLIDSLVKESEILRQQRHAKSVSAIISIFKELCVKWNAICRLESRLIPDGFKKYLQGRMPSIADQL